MTTQQPALVLRTVERDGEIVVEDQDGRLLTNIVHVCREWHVDDAAYFSFDLLDIDNDGNCFPVLQGHDQNKYLHHKERAMSIGREITQERMRQRAREGFDNAHDDGWEDGELANVAAIYAATEDIYDSNARRIAPPSREDGHTVWNKKSHHPRRRQLVHAAAFIVAEIERIDRKVSRARAAK